MKKLLDKKKMAETALRIRLELLKLEQGESRIYIAHDKKFVVIRTE